jgi:flagellar FliG-like protein
MLALGEEHTGKLFGMMHDDEIRAISATMAQLGAVPADAVENLCVDFVKNFGAAGGILGSFESTEGLLLKALPRDRVSQIMEEIRGPAGRTMWDKLGNVSEQILASYLKNEYPQTVAVVLSMIKPDHSARVLMLLPDSFAMEVVMRMLRMESIQKDVLDRVERILRTEFMSNLARASRRDSHQLVAEIFNNFDRKAETRFLGGLEERSRESGREGQVANVHLPGPGATDPGGPASPAARDRQGNAAACAQRRTRSYPQYVPLATIRTGGKNAARGHASPWRGQAESRGGGPGLDRQHRQGIGSRRRNRNQHQQRRQDNRMSMIATPWNAQTA